ncbi:MAG: hypothetical protein ACRC7N_00105 [Clostridium sp.]
MNKFVDLSMEEQEAIEGGATVVVAWLIFDAVVAAVSLGIAIHQGVTHECGTATKSSNGVNKGDKVITRRTNYTKQMTGRYHCYNMCPDHK